MWKSIYTTALIAGTLDILAAFLQAYFTSGILPNTILKYIASGVFGEAAFTGGLEMVLLGLLFHYIIAFACTATFYWAYPKLSILKYNILLNAIAIGVLAWIATTQLIVPISKIDPSPFDLEKALVAVLILIFCIGLPIAYRANQYYKQKHPEGYE